MAGIVVYRHSTLALLVPGSGYDAMADQFTLTPMHPEADIDDLRHVGMAAHLEHRPDLVYRGLVKL